MIRNSSASKNAMTLFRLRKATGRKFASDSAQTLWGKHMNPEPTVFVIHDNAEKAGLLKDHLVGQGFLVRTYESAQSFFDHYIYGIPGCVIVTDLLQQNLPGTALLAEIAAGFDLLFPVYLSSDSDVRKAVYAMKHGAIDFLDINDDFEKLADSVEIALKRSRFALQDSRRREQKKAISSLSMREKEVLGFVAAGLATKEIARRIGISPRTVESHRSSVMKKMGARTLPRLVRLALEAGVVCQSIDL